MCSSTGIAHALLDRNSSVKNKLAQLRKFVFPMTLQVSGHVECYFPLVLYLHARISAQVGIWLWILDRFLRVEATSCPLMASIGQIIEWHIGRLVQEACLRSISSYWDPDSPGAQSPCLAQRQDSANQLIGSMSPLWEAASVGSCKVPASILKL